MCGHTGVTAFFGAVALPVPGVPLPKVPSPDGSELGVEKSPFDTRGGAPPVEERTRFEDQ